MWSLSLQPIATQYPYIYTNYICYQIFVLSPCAHMDLPSSPLSIRNIIISEIRCSGVEWSSILSFHVCKNKNALPLIDNLGTFVWQNRFRGHMSLSCHRNDIAEKNTPRYIHVTYLFAHVCTIRVLLAAQTCNNRTFLYKQETFWLDLQVVAETLTFRDPSSCIHLSFRSQPASRIESHHHYQKTQLNDCPSWSLCISWATNNQAPQDDPSALESFVLDDLHLIARAASSVPSPQPAPASCNKDRISDTWYMCPMNNDTIW